MPPIHGIRLGLCILAGYGPDQLRTTFVVKSEYVRPIRFQCILSVLTVDNVLADLAASVNISLRYKTWH